MTPSLAVVVPVYNEADFIPVALPSLITAVGSLQTPHTVYIVENGSTDGSAEIAEEVAGDAPVEVLRLASADYGAAMRAGFLAANADWIVNFDIDYFSADFLRTVLAQADDVDLVIGSKRDAGSEDRRPWLRRIATFVFNIMLRTILDSRVSDTHGMKAFRQALVTDLAPRVESTKDLFDTELVVRAERAGYRIVEIPVVVEEIRSTRSSLLKRVPRTVAGLFAIRRRLS